MKTTYDLLNAVIELGFEKTYALTVIDLSLDDELGFNNRKPLEEEYISDELYDTILLSFEIEKEQIQE